VKDRPSRGGGGAGSGRWDVGLGGRRPVGGGGTAVLERAQQYAFRGADEFEELKHLAAPHPREDPPSFEFEGKKARFVADSGYHSAVSDRVNYSGVLLSVNQIRGSAAGMINATRSAGPPGGS